MSTSASSVSDPNPDSRRNTTFKWEWRFCLLLEDANPSMEKTKDRMKVFVADDDAVFLLQMDAEEYVVIHDLFYFLSTLDSLFLRLHVHLTSRWNLIRLVTKAYGFFG